MDPIFTPKKIPIVNADLQVKAMFIQAHLEGRHDVVVQLAARVLSLQLTPDEYNLLYFTYARSYNILIQNTQNPSRAPEQDASIPFENTHHAEKLECLGANQRGESKKAADLAAQILKLELSKEEQEIFNDIKLRNEQKINLSSTSEKQYEIAKNAFSEGLYKFAKLTIEGILKIDPSHSKTLQLVSEFFDVALLNFNNKKLEEKEVFEIIEWILKSNPNDQKAQKFVLQYYDVALEQFNNDQKEEALKTIEWVLMCLPDNSRVKGLRDLIKAYEKNVSEKFVNVALNNSASTEEKS